MAVQVRGPLRVYTILVAQPSFEFCAGPAIVAMQIARVAAEEERIDGGSRGEGAFDRAADTAPRERIHGKCSVADRQRCSRAEVADAARARINQPQIQNVRQRRKMLAEKT